MKQLLQSLVLVLFASPAFGQYYYNYNPYYPMVQQVPVPVPTYAPSYWGIDPNGYRPDWIHSVMNPVYATQYAIDVNTAVYAERQRQALQQAEIQRQALVIRAPEMRAKKAERRAISQQRARDAAAVNKGAALQQQTSSTQPKVDDNDPIDL